MAGPAWQLRRRTAAWLVVTWAVCTAALVGVYAYAVRTSSGRLLGDTALRGADVGSALADQVDSTLNVVTATSLIAAVAVIAVVALARLERALGFAAIALLLVANLSSRVLKTYVLSRPDLGLNEVTPSTLNSLPSGHTTAAFSIGIAILFVVPRTMRGPVAVAGVVFASAVALSTMAAGWHRAADSIASFLLVIAWAALAALGVHLSDWTTPDADAAQLTRPRPGRWLTVAAAGLLLLSSVLVVPVALDRELQGSLAGPTLAFLAAGLLIVGVATALTVVALRVVDRITLTIPDPAPGPDAAGT